MGVILLILTWILTPFFEVGNFITTLFVDREKNQFWQFVNNEFQDYAVCRDCYANHNYQISLNFWLSKGGYAFGNPKETISSVLGKKGVEKSLNIWGWCWYYFLYAVDFTQWNNGGHCFASIINF